MIYYYILVGKVIYIKKKYIFLFLECILIIIYFEIFSYNSV